MKNGIIFSRVSTPKQTHDRQVSELHAFAKSMDINVIAVVTETGSGRLPYDERPCLKGVESMIRLGVANTLLCLEASRISRRVDVSEHFLSKIAGKAEVVILSDGLRFLDANSPDMFERARIDRALLYAEMESGFISERVKSGIESAQKRGVRLGRPKGTTESKEKKLSKHSDIVECINHGVSLRKTAKITGKSVATIKRIIGILKSESKLQVA